MKKSYLIMAAIASVALVSCSNEEYFGDPGGLTGERAISFDMSTPAMTRAEGAEAAEKLNNNFVVYGFKTLSDNSTTQKVFDNYQANYVENTAYTTESNSNNWEYVAKTGTYKNVPNGVTTNVGVVAFAANTTDNANGIDQTIKYWDFSATRYDFFAYSLGKGVTTGEAPSTTTSYAKSTAMSNTSYTLTGSTAELQECYISEKIHRAPTQANTTVQFRFLSFNSKVRIGIYETVPGYSIKDVTFYTSNGDANPGATATLYDADGTASIPNGGTYTVTFDDDGKPVLTFATTSDYTNEASQGFGTLTDLVKEEYKEDGGNSEVKNYLKKTANSPSYAGNATKDYYTKVLPNPAGTELTLKVNYTLVSRDGSGETIKAVGGTAKVPANFAKWQPGYAYTYLFKISDNPNSTIGGVAGLYPITFDAMVVETEEGTQNTITTVAEPSITTYQNGDIVDDYATYTPARDIFVTVEDANGALLPLIAENVTKGALYTFTGTHTEAEIMKALQVRTSTVDGTITGRNGIILTPAKDGDNPLLNITNKIGEKTIGDNLVGQFTPAAGNYAFVYTQTAPTGTTPKYEAKSFSAGDAVNGYYCRYYYTPQTGDAQVGTTYYNSTTFVQTALFCGDDATGLYTFEDGIYKPADGKIATGTTYYPEPVAAAAAPSDFSDYLVKDGDNYVQATGNETSTPTYYEKPTAVSPIEFNSFNMNYYKLVGNTPTQVTEEHPVAGTNYYSDDNCNTRVYILPEQTSDYSILTDYTDATTYRLCAAGENAIAGKRYYDKYEQNNGVYAVKVIKVQ